MIYFIDINEITLPEEDWSYYLSKFLFSPGGGMYQQNFKFENDLQCGEPTSQILVRINLSILYFCLMYHFSGINNKF